MMKYYTELCGQEGLLRRSLPLVLLNHQRTSVCAMGLAGVTLTACWTVVEEENGKETDEGVVMRRCGLISVIFYFDFHLFISHFAVINIKCRQCVCLIFCTLYDLSGVDKGDAA